MKSRFLKTITAFGVAAAMAAAVPNFAVAAPMGAGHGEALKSAAPSDTIEVRRWHRRGGYWAGAAVGGLLLGSALAAPYYYGYGPRSYHEPAYAYGQERCWVQTGRYRGQGYYDYC